MLSGEVPQGYRLFAGERRPEPQIHLYRTSYLFLRRSRSHPPTRVVAIRQASSACAEISPFASSAKCNLIRKTHGRSLLRCKCQNLATAHWCNPDKNKFVSSDKKNRESDREGS
jgi:hypothetical protein